MHCIVDLFYTDIKLFTLSNCLSESEVELVILKFLILNIFLFRNFPAHNKNKQAKTNKNNVKMDKGLANDLIFQARLAPNKI